MPLLSSQVKNSIRIALGVFSVRYIPLMSTCKECLLLPVITVISPLDLTPLPLFTTTSHCECLLVALPMLNV